MAKKAQTIDVRALRRRLGLNQQQFWSPIGVTQSGGSRYENDRAMPAPVRELVRLVYEPSDHKAAVHLARLRNAPRQNKEGRAA